MIDIEKLDSLPYVLPMEGKFSDHRRNYKGHRAYKKIGDYYPSTVAERYATKFIGKSVDVAFSAYCKIADKFQQAEFWELFEDTSRWQRRYRAFYGYWYVGKNKTICFQEGYKRPVKVTVESFDIKYGWFNTYTGKPIPQEDSWRIDENNPKFTYGVIEGEVKNFKFKGHKYKKYVAEQLSKARKEDRQQQPKEYSFKHDFPTQNAA